MDRFLRNFNLDRLSFWLGFLAGTLFWIFIGILRPIIASGRKTLLSRAQSARQRLTASAEIRLRNDTLRLAQGLHLAAPLFTLEEILIIPRVLAPPPGAEPGATPPIEDLVSQSLPYMPDWPEMAAAYQAPSLTLAEALGEGANILVIGQPGSGKTVALAHLAIQIANHETNNDVLDRSVPLWVQAADLEFPSLSPNNPLETLIEAVNPYAVSLGQSRLPEFLQTILEDGRALLLLDGLDELPPEPLKEVRNFLSILLQNYPTLRVVATASSEYYDGLTKLGFVPLPMAAWDKQQRRSFINQWSDMWQHHAGTQYQDIEAVDPILMDAWLQTDSAILTPLELTLKVWAAKAGDILGPSAPQAIEAYLRRITISIPKARLALENLSGQMVRTQHFTPFRKEAEAWIAEFETSSPLEFSDNPPEDGTSAAIQEPITIPRVFPALIENGLLKARAHDRMSFIHPLIAAYLASCALSGLEAIQAVLEQPAWMGKTQTLGYLASRGEVSDWLQNYLDQSKEPLFAEIFTAARWARNLPEKSPWRGKILRQLANAAQGESQPLGLRARAVSALASSGGPGVNLLFQQLIGSSQAAQRQLGALGCGLLGDAKSVKELSTLLNDPTQTVHRAACLALVAIGEKGALEAVAGAMLQGGEDLQRAAAEALANHPEEGHPALEEASRVDDLMVRRAATSGLQRVGQPWAIKILENLQVEDAQWVVKTAATQALEQLAQPNSRIPHPLPPLTETPWLIAFAGEHGMGISPGKSAIDMLMLALKEGNEDQKLAALDYLKLYGDETSVPGIYHLLYASQGEIQEAAFNTLWHMEAAGVSLPPPAQYGLGGLR